MGLDLPQTIAVVLTVGLVTAGCQPMSADHADAAIATNKITFDLNQFDDNGLYGPPDGKRSMDYEFCIPEGNDYAEAVMAIDPTLNLLPDSPGRIGCTEDQTLAIGNTHQQDFREVLMELANLEYVERIQQVDWE